MTSCVHVYINAGLDEAKDELDADYTSREIKTLCTHRGNIQVTCFKAASCLLPFAWKFNAMTSVVNSGIFNTIWSTTMKHAYRSNPSMSISDVQEEAWVPAFQQCQDILEQLRCLSMTLADVDRHLNHYQKEGQLMVQLKRLYKGVSECLHQVHEDKWIELTVRRIEEYWKLRGYYKAANTFLKLRDSMELTEGDFTAVEKISREVSLFKIKFFSFFSVKYSLLQ